MTLGWTKRTIIRISKVVESGARNCVFIKTTLEEPHKLIIELIDRCVVLTTMGNSVNIKYTRCNNMIINKHVLSNVRFVVPNHFLQIVFLDHQLQIVVPNHIL